MEFICVKPSSEAHAEKNIVYTNSLIDRYLTVRNGIKTGYFVNVSDIAIGKGEIALNATMRRQLSVRTGGKLTVQSFQCKDRIKRVVFSIKLANENTDEIQPLNYKDVIGEIRTKLVQIDLAYIGEELMILNLGSGVVIRIESMETHVSDNTSGEEKAFVSVGNVDNTTDFDMVIASNSKIVIKGMKKSPSFKKDPCSMGIGGMDKQLTEIFRCAFLSRAFPGDVSEIYGINHVKGIMLYGPPGTGKTLIARKLGELLDSHPPKIINGPEVLNRYVGESERGIRNLFADAENEYQERGNESKLHLIIFDEIDAICRGRGSVSGGIGDSVVNQLLSKMDGVKEINNILIIGMTNRIDLIDEALLRPGRFELKLEITLPDAVGRRQILDIHTGLIRKNELMAPDVDMNDIVAKTNNYSGAELKGLCSKAVSYALGDANSMVDIGKLIDKFGSMAERPKIHHKDFLNALKNMKPALGSYDDQFINYLPVNDTGRYEDIFCGTPMYLDKFINSDTRLSSVLITGPSKCGKTTIAIKMAQRSEFPFVRMISAADMLGRNEV